MRVNEIYKWNPGPQINITSNKSEADKSTTMPKAKMKFAALPSTANYLAFTGGYSINLAQTVKQLDKLKDKYPNIYPPNLREWAQIILDDGNKAQETLIDVHKRLYEGLLECDTLDQAKMKFPEFADVRSSSVVDAQDGSFLADFKQGKLEYFDNDEDLALQLLKLYWAKGFSLRDLKRYVGDRSISHVLEKLNIPTVNKVYGQILKLSDVDYNARLAAEMREKRLARLDRIEQETTGEPVFIKRGKLSDEHKKRISEGLKRYFEQNPEAILTMSERQRKFYQDNPDASFVIRRVMIKAWSLGSGSKIRSAMSDFIKKSGVSNFDEDSLYSATTLPKDGSWLKKFWLQNTWAKKAFSNNMTYAWKIVKEEEGKSYDFRMYPKGFISRFKDWAAKRGMAVDESYFVEKFYPNQFLMERSDDVDEKVFEAFIGSLPEGVYFINKMYNRAAMELWNKLEAKEKAAGGPLKEVYKKLAGGLAEYVFNTAGKGPTEEAKRVLLKTRCTAVFDFYPKILKLVDDSLDTAFDAVAAEYHNKGVNVAFNNAPVSGATHSMRMLSPREHYKMLEEMRKHGTIR